MPGENSAGLASLDVVGAAPPGFKESSLLQAAPWAGCISYIACRSDMPGRLCAAMHDDSTTWSRTAVSSASKAARQAQSSPSRVPAVDAAMPTPRAGLSSGPCVLVCSNPSRKCEMRRRRPMRLPRRCNVTVPITQKPHAFTVLRYHGYCGPDLKSLQVRTADPF